MLTFYCIYPVTEAKLSGKSGTSWLDETQINTADQYIFEIRVRRDYRSVDDAMLAKMLIFFVSEFFNL